MADSSLIPLTFLVPSSTREPMVIELQDQPLRMVVVDKESVSQLDKEWDASGLYFLFGEHSEGLPRYTAYVGKSPAGLRGRIVNHARSREEPWSRALLMTSAAGLDSSAIGWLEGRLHGVLTAASQCDVTNRNRPGDDTLPPYRQVVLEQYIAPISAAMRALGYSPDSAAQHATLDAADGTLSPGAPAGRPSSVTVADLVQSGLLKPGTELRSMASKWDARAVVNVDGTIQIGSERFNSPSMAAVAVAGGRRNGWRFWGIPAGDGSLRPLHDLRPESYRASRERADNSDTYIRFWTQMLEESAAREVVGGRVGPRKNHWLGTSVGPGLLYSFVVSNSKSRAELIFRRGQRAAYEKLRDQNRSWPSDLVWDSGRNAEGQCRVFIPVEGGLPDEENWPSLHSRLVDAMRRLRSIMDEEVLPKK